MPGAVLAGNMIPDRATATPFDCSLTAWGKEPQTEVAGPPEQVMFTLPLKPFSDCASSKKAATVPRRTVSELGLAISLKVALLAAATLKLMLTGAAGA